jgi:hypothetical protein
MGFILILIPLVLFVFVPWIFGLILNAAGLRKFSNFPTPLKGAFYINWIFFNIVGVILIVAMIGDYDGMGELLKNYQGLNYLVMLLFYPLFTGLWRYINDDDRHPAMIFFGFMSLLACCALFLLSITTELFRGASMKIGG